jgi:hypothetical protein
MSISDTIHTVEHDFHARFDFSLFSQSPISQVSGLMEPVNDRDDFKSRIVSLCSIFDHFNKKDMDKSTGTKTSGTRKSFELYLKTKAGNNQCFIDDKVLKPMSMTCLLRDYLVHGKNRNKDKAIRFFGLAEPIIEHEESWKKIFNSYHRIFDSILAVLRDIDLDLLNGDKLNSELQLSLVEQYFKEFCYYFDDRRGVLMLKEVLESGPISDVEISGLFNVEVMTVRRLLYPYKDKLFSVKHSAGNETILTFSPYFYEHKELLLDVIGGKK